MKLSLISFATPSFYHSGCGLIKSAKKFGISDTRIYIKKDFQKTPFYKQYFNITSLNRGAGYWLWKPFYIFQRLKELQENDILIYCDSGVNITAELDPLIKAANISETGVVLFENYQGTSYFPKTKGLSVSEYNLYVEVNKNKYWTKRDAFVLMGLDTEEYWNSPQVNANFQIYRKCNKTLFFVEEWLNYCCNEQILTDSPNKCGLPNFDNLFSHIHDQAIISLLAKKYKIELYRCPSQYGNHYKLKEFRSEGEYLLLPYASVPKMTSPYGTLTSHHRTKVPSFQNRLKIFLGQEKRLLLNKVL